MRDDKVFSSLGLPGIDKSKEVKVLIKDTKDDRVENDFDFARDNIRDIIVSGEKGLEEIREIAISRGEAQDFSAFAAVLRAITQANKSLMDLHKQKQSVNPEPEDEDKSKGNVVNNNFFGSTKELQDMIEKMKKD